MPDSKHSKNIQVCESTHKLVKAYCASHGILMRDFCEKALLIAIGQTQKRRASDKDGDGVDNG